MPSTTIVMRVSYNQHAKSNEEVVDVEKVIWVFTKNKTKAKND